jgi:hypothetical protein
MATSACSRRGAIRDPRSAWAASTSTSAMPDASSAITTSLCHPGRLGLGDPAQAVPADPKPPPDDHRPEPLRELELDRRHDLQLVVVDVVLQTWLGEAEGLADHHQQLQRDTPLRGQLLEGRGAEPGEPIERGLVQEGERERASRTAAAIPSSGTPACSASCSRVTLVTSYGRVLTDAKRSGVPVSIIAARCAGDAWRLVPPAA